MKELLFLVVAAASIIGPCHNHVTAFVALSTTTRIVAPAAGGHQEPHACSNNNNNPNHKNNKHNNHNKIVSSLFLSSWTPPEFDLLNNNNNNNNNNGEQPFNVRVNEFFKQTVPPGIREKFDVRLEDAAFVRTEFDTIELLTSPPASPGVPRPLWLTILGSVPTGLLWYGFYKFSVEEELFQIELDKGEDPKGFGGYGTLGPFVYFSVLGPLAVLLHIPGGLLWSNVGIIFIYYTQFLLYNRVNELYTDMGQEAPLSVWWCLPIFFPFDLIVGLRQVHFLSQYHYATRLRGMKPVPKDPVVELFPFIGKPTLTWPEFLLTPSLWLSFLSSVGPIDRTKFPEPVQELLAWGEGQGQMNDRLQQQRQPKTIQAIDVERNNSPSYESDYFR
ncbi:hypothetical protein ACA910_012430 [Epithemia clementina (nom. ined.)]